MYDKYQTKQVRQKWCRTVEHLAEEPLSVKSMPRKIIIYLAAPPGDGLRSAREHFHAYIKPVLVASATDWDVIEGRREGDVRWKTAERIRKSRRRAGDGPVGEEEQDAAWAVVEARKRSGTEEYQGVGGNLVVGRHTWKEYIRGIHEGWLGPVVSPHAEDEPQKGPPGQEQLQQQSSPGHSSVGDAAVSAATDLATSSPDEKPVDTLSSIAPSDDASPTADPPKEEEKPPEKPKLRNPPPYVETLAYPSSTPSKLCPEILGPSIPIPFPHILGFLNTPLRTYRFLTRRHLADSVGSQVAAAVLASHQALESAEVTSTLEHEERDWYKTVRDRPERVSGESEKDGWVERVWTEEVVLDERLANRMRIFRLSAEDEDRAKRVAAGTEKKAEVLTE